jgi:hypothetical protein
MALTQLKAVLKQSQYKNGNSSSSSSETISVSADVAQKDTAVVTIGWVGSPTVTSVSGLGGGWIPGPVATNGTAKVQMWYAVKVNGGATGAPSRDVRITWSGNVQNTGLYVHVFNGIVGRHIRTFHTNASSGAVNGQWSQRISGTNTASHRITWIGACVAGGAMASHFGPQPEIGTYHTAWPGIRENFNPVTFASSQRLIGAFTTKYYPPPNVAPNEGTEQNAQSQTFQWPMSPNVSSAGAAVLIGFDNKAAEVIDNVKSTGFESIAGNFQPLHPMNDTGVPLVNNDRNFYPLELTSNTSAYSDQGDGRLVIIGMEHAPVDLTALGKQTKDAFGQNLNRMSIRTEDPTYGASVPSWSLARGWYPPDPIGFGPARQIMNDRVFNSQLFPNISACNYSVNGKSYTAVVQPGPWGRHSVTQAAIPQTGPYSGRISDCHWTHWENTTSRTGAPITAYTTSIGGHVAAATIASTAPGRVDVFGVGSDNNIWRIRFRNGAWGGWQNVGGVNRGWPTNRKAEITATVSVSNTAIGRITVFVNGGPTTTSSPSGVWMNWFDENGAMGTWTNVGAFGSQIKAASAGDGGWWLFATREGYPSISGQRNDTMREGYVMRRDSGSTFAAVTYDAGTNYLTGFTQGAHCTDGNKVDMLVSNVNIRSRNGYQQLAWFPFTSSDGIGPVEQIGPRLSQTVAMYGSDGAFKDAATLPALWSGITPTTTHALNGLMPWSQSLGIDTANNLDVHAGHSFYMSHALSDGKVMVLSENQTNNPVQPTSDHATAYVYDPAISSWHHINIRTTAGYTNVVNPANGRVGGTDFSDIQSLSNITSNGANEVLAMVSGGYDDWDIGQYGLYPTMAFFRRKTDGKWEISKTYTAAQIAATRPTAETDAIYTTKAGTNGNWVDTHFVSEVAQFPQSRHVVFGHYLPVEGRQCGAISIVDPVTGILKATYIFPDMRSTVDTSVQVVNQDGVNNSNYDPGDLWLAPREFECGPTSSLNDERFSVILDTYPYPPNPHALQEFSYNALTGSITPTTVPFTVEFQASKRNNDPFGAPGTGHIAEIGTHRYDSSGNMWVTCNYIYSLFPGAPMAVFKKSSGERSYMGPAALT